MSERYKVGDKVIWTGRTGFGGFTPWEVQTVVKVTPAGNFRISEDGPLYNTSGWPRGDSWGRGGSVEKWTAEREAELRAAEEEAKAARAFRDACEQLARIRDKALAARLLALLPQEYKDALEAERQA